MPLSLSPPLSPDVCSSAIAATTATTAADAANTAAGDDDDDDDDHRHSELCDLVMMTFHPHRRRALPITAINTTTAAADRPFPVGDGATAGWVTHTHTHKTNRINQ